MFKMKWANRVIRLTRKKISVIEILGVKSDSLKAWKRPAPITGPIKDPKEQKRVCQRSALSLRIGLSRLRPDLRCTLLTSSFKEHRSKITREKLKMTHPTIRSQVLSGTPISLLGPLIIMPSELRKKDTAIINLLSHSFYCIKLNPIGMKMTLKP